VLLFNLNAFRDYRSKDERLNDRLDDLLKKDEELIALILELKKELEALKTR
jgi:hypothetical protein